MKAFITKHYQEILLVILTCIIFVINITPGAYLTGWDSLQTELDPMLGISRSFFSVWQEFQSFGLTAGMAHAADLVRSILILPMTLLLPDWMVRYTFHIIMILVGGLGMLTLLRYSIKVNTTSPFPLLGSLFYILNFAIIQLLFLPFEAFSIFFAVLPWLIWIYLRLFKKPQLRLRYWLLFLIINILATPAFVAQQLFLVYGMILGLLTIGLLLPSVDIHNFFNNIRLLPRDIPVLVILKRSIVAFVLIVSVNSFWLLPQGYFLLTNGSVVRESKINQIATNDVLYSNIDRGNLSDIVSFNGFFYDRLDQNQNFLFASWKTHRENPVVLGSIYVLFAIVVIGLVSKSTYRLPFLLIFLLVGIALLGNTPGIKELNDLIRDNSFVNQVFRSPFTKFAVPLALVASYFFTVGIMHLSLLLKSHSPQMTKRFVLPMTSLVFGLLIFYQALPIFQGQLFSEQMKVQIPHRYFELMAYLKTQDPNSRIALLPDYTFWGWFHTDYDYNGSGYLWYGVKQPIVSRNFDYWSFESEGYFWEIKNAVEAEDRDLMEKIFEKYDIDIIILDTSLLPIVATQKSLQYDSLMDMLDTSPSLTKKQTWDGLTIYVRTQAQPQKDFVSIATDIPNIGPDTKLQNNDVAYKTYGTYQTTDKNPFDVYFPFLDLFTQTQHVNDTWNILETEANVRVTSGIPFDVSDYTATTSSQTTVDLYESETAINYIVPFENILEQNTISVSFPKVRVDSFSPETANIGYCLKEQGNLISYKNQEVVDITTTDGATGCVEFSNPNLDQRYGYLVSTQTENVTGPRLYFYILDSTKNQAYVEDRILSNSQNYILGPRFQRGLGYSFTFQNTSYRHIPSINRIFNLSVYLMPYEEIHSYKLVRNDLGQIPTAKFTNTFNAQKKNYYTYVVSDVRQAQHQTLILNQAYQPGWTAYATSSDLLDSLFPYIFGQKLEDHVVINNWANGWNIPNDKQYATSDKFVIIYLPQYLQYLGFGLLFIPLIILFVASIRGKKSSQNLTNNELVV